MPQTVDISGQVFGRLTANKPCQARGNDGGTYWWLTCTCGANWVIRSLKSLRNSMRLGRSPCCMTCQAEDRRKRKT